MSNIEGIARPGEKADPDRPALSETLRGSRRRGMNHKSCKEQRLYTIGTDTPPGRRTSRLRSSSILTESFFDDCANRILETLDFSIEHQEIGIGIWRFTHPNCLGRAA